MDISEEDYRTEAAVLHILQESQIGIVFTVPKERKKKEELVHGRYFSWIATDPPSFHKSRALAEIVSDRELTVNVTLNGVVLVIPRLVYEICTYLKRSEQLGIEGLFRKSGNASRVRMLQQHLDAYGRLPGKDIKENKYTCHDLVQVLKAFLRHLPGGIIHFLYKSFLVAQRTKLEEDMVTGRTNEQAKIFGMHMTMCLCYLLPKPNQHLLQYLMHFFVEHFGPAQEACQAQNTMTLVNIARIFGPTLLPITDAASRQGSQEENDLIISAVQDMMLGFKEGLLYTRYLDMICERASHITIQDARRIYKTQFVDKLTKPKRRSRASGIGDALRSAGEEVMKQLNRRGSSRSSLNDAVSSRNTSVCNLQSAVLNQGSSDCSHQNAERKSCKRNSGSAHELDNNGEPSRQRYKFGEDPQIHGKTDLRPMAASVISAAEAKRKTSDKGQQATSRLQGIDSASSRLSSEPFKDGPPRNRRRSFETARRFGGGLSGSAKKVKKFVQRRRSGRLSDTSKQQQCDGNKVSAIEITDTVDSTEARDKFLSLISQSNHSDSEAISLDEFHTFSQMCYDVQKSASNTDIPCTRYFQAAVTKSPVRDPRKKLNNDDSQKVENQKLETIEQLTRKPRVGQPLVLRPPQRRFGGMGRDKVADTPSRCLLQPSPNTDDKFLSAYRARLQVTTKFNESSKGGSSKVAILESEQTNKRGKQRTSEMNTSGKGHRTALSNINNTSGRGNKLRSPLLDDRLTFV